MGAKSGYGGHVFKGWVGLDNSSYAQVQLAGMIWVKSSRLRAR